MTAFAEKNTAITGIGLSDVSRGASKSALSLTVDAAMEAIRDAGLTRAEIDGVATWPGERADGSVQRHRRNRRRIVPQRSDFPYNV